MRKNHFQLPSYEELREILECEEFRNLPAGNEELHFADFSTIIKLLKFYNLSTSFFDSKVNFSDFKRTDLFNGVVQLFEDLEQNILISPCNDELKSMFDALYEYLSEEDKPEEVDFIFVFGSKSNFRIEKAISLYKLKYAPKIFISGKGPYYEEGSHGLAEAEKLAEFATSQGIPPGDILVEKKSITVPDNVKRSLNMLDGMRISNPSFILVNSTFSQRRGWAHFKKFSNTGTKIIRCNVDSVSEQYSKDGWHKSEIGIRVILKEFFGLRMSEILNTS